MKNAKKFICTLACPATLCLAFAAWADIGATPDLPPSRTDAPLPTVGTTPGERLKRNDPLTSDVSPGVVETLRSLHADNLKEIEMGHLAQQQGTLPETRAYGRTLASDHMKLDGKVMALLKRRSPADASLSVNATSDGHGNAQLDNQHGAAWDLAFAKMMAVDHAKTIQMVRAGRNGISDKRFTSMLSGFLPTLQKHQRTAKKIEAKAAKLTAVSDGR